MPLVHHGKNKEQIRVLRKIAGALRFQSNLLVVDQPPVDARTFTLGEDVGGEPQRVSVWSAVGGHVVAFHERRQRHIEPQLQHPPRRLDRLLGDVPRGQPRPARERRKVFPYHVLRLLRVQVAHHHHRGVVGHVIRIVEVSNILQPGIIQIVHTPDGHVPVGMHGVSGRIQVFHHRPIGRVVEPQAPFLFHHLPLVTENTLGDLEVAHPVGLEPQHHRKLRTRRGFPEDRRVLGRVGVVDAARTNDVVGELLRPNVGRAVKHQVFEEMREARPARRLVLRAHVVPHLNVHDGRLVVLHQKCLKTIV